MKPYRFGRVVWQAFSLLCNPKIACNSKFPCISKLACNSKPFSISSTALALGTVHGRSFFYCLGFRLLFKIVKNSVGLAVLFLAFWLFLFYRVFEITFGFSAFFGVYGVRLTWQ